MKKTLEHDGKIVPKHAKMMTAMLRGSFKLSYVIDREGKFITANAAALRLFGYRKSDLPSLSLASLLDPGDYREAVSIIENIIRVGYNEGIVQFRLKSSRGSRIWIETIGMAVKLNARSHAIQGIARDITSIKTDELFVRAQRDIAIILGEAVDLREAMARVLDAALGFDSIDGGGVYLVDEQTGAFRLAAHRGLSDEFVRQNARFGADSEYAGIIRSGECFHRIHSQIRVLPDPRFAREGFRSMCVIPVLHHGAVIASFNLASRSIDRIPATVIAGFEAIAFQIGATLVRIRAEEALRESEDRYRSIIENSILGIAVSDLNDMVLVNRSMAVMLGYTVEELMPMRIADVFAMIHPDDRDLVRRRYMDRIEGRDAPERYQYRFIRKNGEILWADVSTTMITYRGRRAQIAMIADITEQVRAAEQLRESGIRLSLLSDNLPGGLVYQIDTGADGLERRFTYISAGVEPLHGITIVEALNDAMAVYGQVVEEDRPMLSEREAAAIANMRSFNAEVRVRLPSGEIRWRYFASAPRRLENGRLVWDGIEIDITDWKLAEKDLERERDRARLYLDIAGVMMVLIDSEGTVRLVNKKASEVLRREESDIVGRNWFDTALPERERENVRQVHRDLMEGNSGPREYVENRVVTKTGEERLVAWHNIVLRDEAGRITGTLSSGEDITERRVAEEAKQKSDQMFRAVVENSYDAVTMIASDGTILYDSPSITRILGYLHDERIGKNVAEFVIPAERQNLENGLRAFAEKFGGVMHYMARFVHKDGSTRWVEGVRTNMLNDPLVRAIVVNYRDITERKEAEERILQSLHEKDVLLAEVHHRVKNNLQSVISLFNINEEKIRDEQSRDVFNDIQGKVYSMALIHEMLYRSGDFTAIDMGPYIRELVNEIFRAYSASMERITLHLKISGIMIGLRQALPCGLLVHELVLNIVKHAFTGQREGVITIEMNEAADGGIDLTIGDNGTGLPPEISEEGGGSMGITLVRGWVRQMRATMEIDRSQGTRYIIHIPHSGEKAGGQ